MNVILVLAVISFLIGSPSYAAVAPECYAKLVRARKLSDELSTLNLLSGRGKDRLTVENTCKGELSEDAVLNTKAEIVKELNEIDSQISGLAWCPFSMKAYPQRTEVVIETVKTVVAEVQSILKLSAGTSAQHIQEVSKNRLVWAALEASIEEAKKENIKSVLLKGVEQFEKQGIPTPESSEDFQVLFNQFLASYNVYRSAVAASVYNISCADSWRASDTDTGKRCLNCSCTLQPKVKMERNDPLMGLIGRSGPRCNLISEAMATSLNLANVLVDGSMADMDAKARSKITSEIPRKLKLVCSPRAVYEPIDKFTHSQTHVEGKVSSETEGFPIFLMAPFDPTMQLNANISTPLNPITIREASASFEKTIRIAKAGEELKLDDDEPLPDGALLNCSMGYSVEYADSKSWNVSYINGGIGQGESSVKRVALGGSVEFPEERTLYPQGFPVGGVPARLAADLCNMFFAKKRAALVRMFEINLGGQYRRMAKEIVASETFKQKSCVNDLGCYPSAFNFCSYKTKEKNVNGQSFVVVDSQPICARRPLVLGSSTGRNDASSRAQCATPNQGSWAIAGPCPPGSACVRSAYNDPNFPTQDISCRLERDIPVPTVPWHHVEKIFDERTFPKVLETQGGYKNSESLSTQGPQYYGIDAGKVYCSYRNSCGTPATFDRKSWKTGYVYLHNDGLQKASLQWQFYFGYSPANYNSPKVPIGPGTCASSLPVDKFAQDFVKGNLPDERLLDLFNEVVIPASRCAAKDGHCTWEIGECFVAGR